MKNITLLCIVLVLACGMSLTSKGMQPDDGFELETFVHGKKMALQKEVMCKEYWMNVSEWSLKKLTGYLNTVKNFVCYAKRPSECNTSSLEIFIDFQLLEDTDTAYIFDFSDRVFSNMLLLVAIEREVTCLAIALILAHQRETLVNQIPESVVNLANDRLFSDAFKQALVLERKEVVAHMLPIIWDSQLKEAAAQQALLAIVQANSVAYATELLNTKEFLLLLDMSSLYKVRNACRDSTLRDLVCRRRAEKECCLF